MADYFFGITDKGKCREKNEDTFFARETTDTRFLVAGVIDGVGGYEGGDVAAGIASAVILESLETISGNVVESLRNAVIAGNAKINEQKKETSTHGQMACVLTCVVADIQNNKCWYAHVGDTRVYLLRDDSLVKISRDHSVVGFLEESGRLSEEEAMRHPRRNEITKALGFEEDIDTPEDFIETGESPFLPGDLLLLCSDGLTDMISSATIMQVLTSKNNIESKARALVDAANDAGGNDNITAVLVENNNWPKQKPEPVSVERKKNKIATPFETNKSVPNENRNPPKKNKQSAIAFFAVIVVVLTAVFITAGFQKNNTLTLANIVPVKKEKKKDEQLLQLIAHVNDSSKNYTLLRANSKLQITEPITITKDSFHLSANGLVLTADSLFKGPAFIISATAKNIVLDSIVFENFDVGMIVNRNNITFRHVRFVNCRVPVQYVVSLPDSVISGRFKDSIFITKSKLK
jgi:serine/threonine protein phosphatase PrpC